MVIGIDPVVLRLGPLAVRWFGLLALVGLGLAVWLSLRELDRARLPRNAALDALAWGLPAGLLVARLVYVLGWWDYYLTQGADVWRLDIAGLSLWGGLVGGFALALARLRRVRDPLRRRRMLDVVAPNIALGVAIGQLGAFLDGHGQGVPATLAWATSYTNPLAATPDFGVARHPVQLYDMLAALTLFGVLKCMPRRSPAGLRVAVLCVVFAAIRLGLGGVQLDPPFLFGLQIEQILALGVLAFGVWYGVRPLLLMRIRRRSPAPASSARPREDSLAA